MQDYWPSVYCDGVPQNNESEIIFYYVLFTPFFETDDVWKRVQELTARKKLGYRSAVSPEPMTAGYMHIICINLIGSVFYW